MPTPRQHGGAALAKIPLVLPGFKGLNTAQKSGILGAEWATTLTNAVIDSNARVAARRGWDTLTTSPAADPFVQIHVQRTHTGTQRIVASTADALFASTDGGASWVNVTGALTPSGGNWQFANFGDAIYAAQEGETLISSSSGDFATVVGNDVPSGNCLLSAYGRLWAADSNGTDLRYSALLDGDDWDGSDAGVLDLRNVWPETDTITALAAHNGLLVVFGRRNIVIYADPSGSALGIDPTAIVVSDLITGVGCVARDSVQSVNGDLWFLSEAGLQSLGRLVVQKSNPLDNLSKNVHDEIERRMRAAASVLGTTRSIYSPRDKLYLLSIPADSATGGVVAFDTRGLLEDGAARCVGIWTLHPSSFAIYDNEIIMSLGSEAPGEVGAYRGGLDNGKDFEFLYESGWLDLTQQGFLLIPKRYSGTFYTDATTNVAFRWAFDFSTQYRTVNREFVAGGISPEFGVAEFGEVEFGGGVALRSGQVPGSGTGQFIKLGAQSQISGQTFSIQQLDLFCKIGRYA